ncbi:hypothetical protein SFB6_026G0 [Candidatus Arthromitus sp. SFB-co]|nr:hypothetical protein SFB6_026G0 [Candidatus Arthromitus sp. SFB-co]
MNEFNTTSSSLNSESLALQITLSKMLNEAEPQRLFQSLGIRLN